MPLVDKNPFPLGKLAPTSGTAVKLTSNFSSDATITGAVASKLTVHALNTNTGIVYIGYSGMNKSTGANVIDFMTAGQSWQYGDYTSLNTIEPDKLYVDVDTTGDAAIASMHIR